MTFFEPSPVFLAFIFAKKFLYLELLALLALIRAVVGHGPARLAASVTLAGALCAISIVFAPALNLTSVPVYAMGARFLAWGSGVLPLVMLSLPLLASAVLPGTRWRWIDAVHAISIAALGALWCATLI